MGRVESVGIGSAEALCIGVCQKWQALRGDDFGKASTSGFDI